MKKTILLLSLLLLSSGLSTAAEYSVPVSEGSMSIVIDVPEVSLTQEQLPLIPVRNPQTPRDIVQTYYALAHAQTLEGIPALFSADDGSRQRIVDKIATGYLDKMKNLQKLSFLGGYRVNNTNVVWVLLQGETTKLPWQHAVQCGAGECRISDAAENFGDEQLRLAGLLTSLVIDGKAAKIPAEKEQEGVCNITISPFSDTDFSDTMRIDVDIDFAKVRHINISGVLSSTEQFAQLQPIQNAVLALIARVRQEAPAQAGDNDSPGMKTSTALSKLVLWPKVLLHQEHKQLRYVRLVPERVQETIAGWRDITWLGRVQSAGEQNVHVFFRAGDLRDEATMLTYQLPLKATSGHAEGNDWIEQMFSSDHVMRALNKCADQHLPANKE